MKTFSIGDIVYYKDNKCYFTVEVTSMEENIFGGIILYIDGSCPTHYVGRDYHPFATKVFNILTSNYDKLFKALDILETKLDGSR